MLSPQFRFVPAALVMLAGAVSVSAADHIRALQEAAIQERKADFGHWGTTPGNYLQWASHSNRLIPVYTFGTANAGPGISVSSYLGDHSPYRSEEALKKLYGRVPTGTLNPAAEYFDQTNVFDIQKAALAAGKKHIILVVFDGMDWQTTRAAAIAKTNSVAYDSGRGTGLHFQDYMAGGTSEFGWVVTAPYVDDATYDTNTQKLTRIDESGLGGYAFEVAGTTPWAISSDVRYPIGQGQVALIKHPYTDSASSATSLNTGVKTYNAAINVDHNGQQVDAISHLAQRQGYRIGVVTSVPISHATPACAYSHNVHRDDYQDLTRDLLGLKSISHPEQPLPGVDLLLGAGFGVTTARDAGQGTNYIPGNRYLAEQDLQAADVRNGGRYVVAIRTDGVDGAESLRARAQDAMEANQRLLGFFGQTDGGGHLPYQTADGKYDPAPGKSRRAEDYTEADLKENPTLPQMTQTALAFCGRGNAPFWLMVEAGDVDWANHDNNIDNSIGAVLSGDAAVKAITDWVEKNSNWNETVLIVTADHGHYLNYVNPQLLVTPPGEAGK